jgi:quercetin dioxygenase-like cupin family protein
MGYMLSGKLTMTTGRETFTARSGDVIYLKREIPAQWENTGSNVARILWIKIM